MRTLTCPYCHAKIPYEENLKEGDSILCINCNATHELYKTKITLNKELENSGDLRDELISPTEERRSTIVDSSVKPYIENIAHKATSNSSKIWLISLVILILIYIGGNLYFNNRDETLKSSATSIVKSASKDSDTTRLPQNASTKVRYEILREPNNGYGVFDFMYIVYVPSKISNAEALWIFNDIKSRKIHDKIAIDIWSNKKAFFEELKIYQEEDKVYDAGGDLKTFAKKKRMITDKYDKFNIAQYTDNGVDVSVKLPEQK